MPAPSRRPPNRANAPSPATGGRATRSGGASVRSVAQTRATSVLEASPIAGDGADADVAAAMQAIRRIVQRLRAANHGVVRSVGLSAAQQFVLAALEAAPAESMQELARRTMTDRSSVADVVERLREERYVVCRPSPVDHRRTTIRISARGREALARAPEPPTALLVRALTRLHSGERRTLARLLTRLTVEMGLVGEPASMLFEDAPSSGGGRRGTSGRS